MSFSVKPLAIYLLLITLLAACNLSSNEPPDTIEELDVQVTDVPESSPTPLPDIATQTPVQPTALPLPTQSFSVAATAPPTSAPVQAAPVLQSWAGDERSYGLSSQNGLTGDGLNLLNVAMAHYAANPVDNRFSVIDSAGNLYITEPGAVNAFRVEQSPYSQYPATSAEQNNAKAESAAWSPNGQYLAFIVNGDRQAADGLWFFQPGAFGPVQLIVDCPVRGFIGCNIVRPSPADNIGLWESREIHWSPDSQQILISANLPDQVRRGIMLKPITRDEHNRDQRPAIWLYDYGTWGADGRILASGRNPDGVSGIFWLNQQGAPSQTVFNASASGLWVGWAVQQPNGNIVALGRAGNPDGPVAIYNSSGTALTGQIGSGFPQRVVWSPDRSAVLIETGGRQYVAQTNGQITDITNNSGGLPVNWLR